MDESLNQQISVKDDCPMGCKLLLYGNKVSHVWLFVCTIRIRIGFSVPAAAVIRRIRALSGFIGFKGSVGGLLSQL